MEVKFNLNYFSYLFEYYWFDVPPQHDVVVHRVYLIIFPCPQRQGTENVSFKL